MLLVAVNILLNLAENIQIERKMKKRKISKLLVRLLERNNTHLILITLVFLKKLSIFSENKNQMVESNIFSKLPRLLKCSNENIIMMSLRLLVNLSFDKPARELALNEKIIPVLVELLRKPKFRAIIIILLYQITNDDNTREGFHKTEAMFLIYKLIKHFPEQIVGRELVSLAINLCTVKQNAEALGKGDQLEALIKRATTKGDILMFKLLRNVAQFAPTKHI
jgi:hypothetical protein